MEPNAEVPQTRPIKDIDLGCTTRFRCNSAELCLLVLGLSAVFGMGMGSCYLFLTPNCPVCPPCPRAPECSLACPSCTCNYQAHDTCVCPAPVICSTEKPTTISTATMIKKADTKAVQLPPRVKG